MEQEEKDFEMSDIKFEETDYDEVIPFMHVAFIVIILAIALISIIKMSQVIKLVLLIPCFITGVYLGFLELYLSVPLLKNLIKGNTILSKLVPCFFK